jgi:hypothetical protein
MFLLLETGAELPGVGVEGEVVIASHAGVALLEAADRLGDLVGAFEPAGGDPPGEFVEIGEQAAFVFGADGAVFVAALLAASRAQRWCLRHGGS